MSTPTRCLLDKVTARFAVQGLIKLERGQDLTIEETFTLDLVQQSYQADLLLFLAPSSLTVLHRLMKLPHYTNAISLFLNQVQSLEPTRYYKRWTRRLREFSFGKEDAAMLALATFGTDLQGGILGVDYFATFDQPMINNWTIQAVAIRTRLVHMQQNIFPPYSHASFPSVLRPEEVTGLI